jgi:acyl-CoA thioesterase
MRLSGLRPTEVGYGMATWAMPATGWWRLGTGMFLHGALAFVADSALGSAVLATVPPGKAITTAQIGIDFLRTPNIRSGSIIGRGRLLHAAGSLGLSEAYIEDGKGRALAHATCRCVLVDSGSRGGRTTSELNQPEQDTSAPDVYELEPEGVVEPVELWNEMSGLDRLKHIQSHVYPSPITRFLALRVIDVGDGDVTIGMAASHWLTNWGGVIYGGAVSALAEGASTSAAISTLPSATACAPLDLKVNFLRPAFPHEGEVVARAKVIYRGRTIAIIQTDLYSQDKLVAVANETLLVLPDRGWDKPLKVADEIVPPSDESESESESN